MDNDTDLDFNGTRAPERYAGLGYVELMAAIDADWKEAAR